MKSLGKKRRLACVYVCWKNLGCLLLMTNIAGNSYRLLQFATMYDLEKTKLGCENLIGYLMYVFAYDLFSIPVIDALVDLTLPLGEKSARGFKPLGKVTRFWNSL